MRQATLQTHPDANLKIIITLLLPWFPLQGWVTYKYTLSTASLVFNLKLFLSFNSHCYCFTQPVEGETDQLLFCLYSPCFSWLDNDFLFTYSSSMWDNTMLTVWQEGLSISCEHKSITFLNHIPICCFQSFVSLCRWSKICGRLQEMSILKDLLKVRFTCKLRLTVLTLMTGIT